MVFDQVLVKAPADTALLLARPSTTGSARIGFILSKKNVKHAVQRNRIKRLTREFFRLHQETLPHLDIIFMGRKGLDRLSNEEFHKLLDKLFRKLKKRAENVSRPN